MDTRKPYILQNKLSGVHIYIENVDYMNVEIFDSLNGIVLAI